MSRIEPLAQAAFAAVVLSAATAWAYRAGGLRGLWLAGGAGLAVLEGLLLWAWLSSPGEGRFWVTALAVVPPVVLVTLIVELLSRGHVAPAAVVLAGSAAGVAGYVAAAFLGYAWLVSLR